MAHARRELLLRVHRHRLRREDLEDCYSQATLELVAQARAGGCGSPAGCTCANTLEQRFLSRITTVAARCRDAARCRRRWTGAMSLGGVGEQEIELADVARRAREAS